MRRVIAAAVMAGLAPAGALTTPAAAADRNPTGSASTAQPAAAMKTVVYEGYALQVPASWPVYRLDENPQACVRYDIHAVYLGTPGPDMRCPAGIVGRTQTVSFIPGRGGASAPGSGTAAQPAAGGTELQRVPAVNGAITQHAAQQEMQVTLGAAAPRATVLGTYGTDPALIERVLASLHAAPAGAAATRQSGSARALAQPPPGRAAVLPQRAPAAPATAAPPPKPTKQPPPTPAPPPKPVRPVGGFDACTAPSLATMRVFRSHYAAVGIYIGGINYACTYGNLSASWVSSAVAMGWGMLPTYAGPQAPCWTGGPGVLINAKTAAAEGRAAAIDAAADARHFGLPKGSPIYYDMEAYAGAASCKEAVLQFLSAWDSQLAAGGYVSAVYSSLDSGIANVQDWTVGKTQGFTPPGAVWIAQWDNVPSLRGGLAWPASRQDKQYVGNVYAVIGGITLLVDKDAVGGPVARLANGAKRGIWFA